MGLSLAGAEVSWEMCVYVNGKMESACIFVDVRRLSFWSTLVQR